MLIDLGEVRGSSAEAPPGDGRRSLWRKALLVVTMLPVLSAGAEAAGPAPEILVVADVELPSVFGSIDLADGAVIHRSRDAVSVYEFDGRLRWITPVPAATGQWSATAGQGLILIHSYAADLPRTTALGLADGREMWSFPGFAGVVGDAVTVNRGTTGGFAVHDRGTRALLWEADGLSFGFDSGTGFVLGLARDGTLSERQLRTGRITRSVRLDLPFSQFYSINFHDGDVVVAYHVAGSAADRPLGAIRLDRATFSVESLTAEEATWSDISSPDCGEVRCEIIFRDGRLRIVVLDPRSGERLWEVPPDRDLQVLPSGLTSYVSHRTGSVPTIQVHDPRTGRVSRTISDWWTIRAGDDARIAPVVMRERQRVRPVQTFLARLTPAGLRVLGSLRYEFIECRYAGDYLVCMSVTRRLIVMKIKPAA